jgi:serine/threonine-protein kinase
MSWSVAVIKWGSSRWDQYGVLVPDIVGETEQDAIDAIEAASLVAATPTDGSSTTLSIGDVVSSNPAAGVLVVVSSTVNFVVSLGTIIPLVLGMLEAVAIETIEAAGLGAFPSYQNDETVPAGIAMGQFPQAGGYLEPGDPISFAVSLGPE